MNAQNGFQTKEWSYFIDPGLQSSVELALDLGMPLLVTGEPGTGKTKLAWYVAQSVLETDLLIFNTKTTSKAKDLLYKYNALTHFRASQNKNSESDNPMNFINFEALGKAIVDSGKKRYVVLVDEIDKAPRDFPNDVLYEFENLSFKVDEASAKEVAEWRSRMAPDIEVDEQGYFRIHRAAAERPVLILTSNSEKNLPDAFLRRCIYYHIPFPNAERLREIVLSNIQLSEEFQQRMLADAIAHFLEIRDKGLRKKPATAELLAWMHILHKREIPLAEGLKMDSDEDIKEKVLHSYSILVKNKDDLERLQTDLW